MRYGRYVPCEWTVYLPSRLSNISAVTEAGRQITLVTPPVRLKAELSKSILIYRYKHY